MERVTEVLHQGDVGTSGNPESESIAQCEREIAIAIGRAELLARIFRAKVAELDEARRYLDHLVQSEAGPGMKERLQRENVAVGVARLLVDATPDLERKTREGAHDADRRSAPDAVLQGSAPRQSISEDPVGAGAAIGEGSWVVVPDPRARPHDVASFARQLQDLRGALSGDDSHSDHESEETNERSLHWSGECVTGKISGRVPNSSTITCLTLSFLDSRLTERRNPRTASIDLATSVEIVDLMNAEDRTVPEAVATQRTEIARAIELAEDAFRAGGRLLYIGAGTSGRLGVLDASECPPTFGTDPEMVQGIIAGGLQALTKSQEGAEDVASDGAAAMDEREVGPSDFVVGIAASGTTPYVRGALERALERGTRTAILACSPPPPDLVQRMDVAILPLTGPEVVTGSTRLKAGTATKMVLNMITTGAMIRLGKTYGNLMVDLRAMSQKLVDRGERILMEVCGVPREEARRLIHAAHGSVKTAIVMQKLSTTREEAERLLASSRGVVRRVVPGAPPPPST
jgi:N-acetylmuramic acid 6-phosphate etherase